MANRLKEKYLNEVVPALTEQFNYSSVMAVPKVDKIVLNMGVGEVLLSLYFCEYMISHL